MISGVISFLKQERYQRMISGLLFIAWTVLSLIAMDAWWQISSIQISYFYIFLVPAICLLTHLIFNGRISWLFVFVPWCLFLVYSMATFIYTLYERLQWTTKGNYEVSDFILVVVYFGILICLTWVLYIMRPAAEISVIQKTKLSS